MAHPFIDVQGLAGAWTLGTVQAGFDLIGRRSLPGGFGDNVVDHNRHLLPGDWEQQTGQWETWEPMEAAYVCGTPPCSGFSLLNTSKGKNARGSDSIINDCMKALVRYSALCKGTDGLPGPQIVSFESVQGAFSQGRELMQSLRAMMEEDTGQAYTLTHVKMSGSAVGGAQMRHRYYFVIHRIPFGVNTPEKKRVVTYADAIGDLIGADFVWEHQPYPAPATWWSADKRDADRGLDCHIHPTTGKFVELVKELEPMWHPGEDIQKPVKRLGRKPEAVKEKRYTHGADQPLAGWTWPRRIDPRKPGYVITGGGILSFVHWAEPRFLTVREISRLMGYPDTWRWDFASSPMQASLLIGKCCPVQSGRWISEAVRDALDGEPQPGDANTKLIGEREYLHDSTNVYKPWLKEQLEATA